jgi:hypothetical protein
VLQQTVLFRTTVISHLYTGNSRLHPFVVENIWNCSSFNNKQYGVLKKLWFFIVLALLRLLPAAAQASNCVLKNPLITIHFGAGDVRDLNTTEPENYSRVGTSCPSDGYYSYTSYTSDCFRGDWFTLPEDHTPGDVNGNMMLVNASYNSGVFFQTNLTGLKSNTTYQFGVWLMNVCRISDKCPFPLLPNLTIRLQTSTGKMVAQLSTGELPRRAAPHWTQYRALFTTPASVTSLIVTMQDNSPGGCGNDFALDDITIRECVKEIPPVTVKPKTILPTATQQPAVTKQTQKKVAATPPPLVQQKRVTAVPKSETDLPSQTKPVLVQKQLSLPPPPPLLVSRANPVIKEITTAKGSIKIDLYDNGEIDGDTVTIYHNNVLLVANARLSQKPISFTIPVDAAQPHHELVMVANNLGSIPPNTSLMIVTAKDKRYQVFISSTEQKNAKVVIDLAE